MKLKPPFAELDGNDARAAWGWWRGVLVRLHKRRERARARRIAESGELRLVSALEEAEGVCAVLRTEAPQSSAMVTRTGGPPEPREAKAEVRPRTFRFGVLEFELAFHRAPLAADRSGRALVRAKIELLSEDGSERVLTLDIDSNRTLSVTRYSAGRSISIGEPVKLQSPTQWTAIRLQRDDGGFRLHGGESGVPIICDTPIPSLVQARVVVSYEAEQTDKDYAEVWFRNLMRRL